MLLTLPVAHAERTVTDQLGRQVTLPDRVNLVVVLQHQTLNLLVQLDAQDDIVGVLNVAAAVKGARQVSLEQALQWNPQVIFVQDRYPQVVKEIASDPGWHKLLIIILPNYCPASASIARAIASRVSSLRLIF